MRLKCRKCKFVFWNNPIPCVSFLLAKGGKILLTQRAKGPLKGYWCLPGGFLEYEESPKEGIKREIEEELRIKILIKQLVGVYQIDNDPRGMHIDIVFVGKGTGKPKLNNELSDYKYFTKNALPKNIAFKHRQAITDFFN